MNDFSVTVVIAGNTYTLRTGDLKSLRDMPAQDRDQLIDLLEALKAQREKSERLVQHTLAKNTANRAAARSAINANQNAPAERLGKGDVDAIMSRLIMEERQQRKPGLKRATIYKFAAAINPINIFAVVYAVHAIPIIDFFYRNKSINFINSIIHILRPRKVPL